MKMRFKNGTAKVLTFSYDDGVIQDKRLIKIMNKYGIKGTFNINSGLFTPEDIVREHSSGRLKFSEAKDLYMNSGHEIALHSLSHVSLNKLDSAEIIYQVVEDKRNIESQFGVLARGMSYPYGAYSDEVIDVLNKCHISYSRTVDSTYSFELPQNWLALNPTCHHNYKNLQECISKFIEIPNKRGNVEMFYLWGHSYEFDNDDNWNVIEAFARKAGGYNHIWYATNIEIYDYVKAYEGLQTSYEKNIIHNPSSIDVWFECRDKVYCVKSGETIRV